VSAYVKTLSGFRDAQPLLHCRPLAGGSSLIRVPDNGQHQSQTAPRRALPGIRKSSLPTGGEDARIVARMVAERRATRATI
jgi:hypothetical protein